MTANKAPDTFAIPGMKELQAETKGSSDVFIAVLDGPVDLSHVCFAGANEDNQPG